MPVTTVTRIAAGRAILITEAAVATGISPRQINRLIDDAMLPKSAYVKSGGRRALRAFALPMVSFGASDGTKLSRSMRMEAMRVIGKFARENWPRLRGEPEHARQLRLESGCVTISLGGPVSAAMAGLSRLDDALRRITEDPDVRGGLPVIRGTRISVYEIADALSSDGMENAQADFPALSREDIEAAALFAKARPRTGRPPAGSRSRRLVTQKTIGITGRDRRPDKRP
jgi:uncharacterized protein (DUF433 family)